jgi:hypothetical protein
MAKTTRKPRLQTYRAKDIQSLEHKSVLLSNTSKRLRKVVTSIPIPASHPENSGGDDGLAGMMVDDSMDLHADANVGATDFEHPAALCVRTKAKRYKNSVLWSNIFIFARANG